MKYYGFIYEGQFANYQVEGLQAFDSPYEALFYANQKWQKNSDLQIPRLLVVKQSDCAEKEYAFFQFTDYKACNQFIQYNENIIWSSNDNQKWNGNAKQMKRNEF